MIASHFNLVLAFALVLVHISTFLLCSSSSHIGWTTSICTSFSLDFLIQNRTLDTIKVRLGLFDSETINVSHEWGKVINRVVSFSSKEGNPKSCNCERVLVKEDKCSTTLFDSSSCIHHFLTHQVLIKLHFLKYETHLIYRCGNFSFSHTSEEVVKPFRSTNISSNTTILNHLDVSDGLFI